MRRFVALMLSGVVLASSVSFPVTAATEKAVADIISVDTRAGSISPSQEALEATIKTVKAKITIPAEYSEFNYYFNDATLYSDANWNFTWSTKDGNSHITISCDNDFHIINYNQYDYSKTETGLSKYLKKELKKAAEDFIAKVAPEIAGKLEYVDADFDGIYSGNYVYHYQRTEKGIAFPDNNVRVSVNSITGKVNAFYANWLYTAKAPSSDAVISKDEATKLIKNNLKMKLVYRSNYYGIYDKQGTTKKKAFLVYEPSQPYISIDAKSGKVYLSKSEWVNMQNESAQKQMDTALATSNSGVAGGNIVLTDEELEQVKELKNIISKEKAIKIITDNTSLYLDENLTVQSSNLSKRDYNGKSSYVWEISLSDPREIDYEKDKSYYRGYAYASVDAVTGNILSYYSSVKSYYDEINRKWETVKVPYNQKQAQEILEKFMKKQAKDRFSNTVLVDSRNDYIAYYKKETPVYGGYQYQYNRVHQSIEYPNNNLYGAVDGVTGKIYSFGSNWDESVEFESPKGAMTAEQAMDAFLSKDGYELKYEINQVTKYDDTKKSKDLLNTASTKVEFEVRLVYHPGANPSYISPFTGDQLTYSGEVYKEVKPYTYLDIKDEATYRNILLLADMNIGFEGDSFLPNQEITVGEINELLNKIGSIYYNPEDTTAVANTSLITREEIAHTFIKKLGLEKIANLSGIYKTGFADESSIGEKYLGAVALAKGYGLMKADGENKFNPKSKVTRFDAVELIMNYIKVQRDGIN